MTLTQAVIQFGYRTAAALIWIIFGGIIASDSTDDWQAQSPIHRIAFLVLCVAVGGIAHWLMSLGYRHREGYESVKIPKTPKFTGFSVDFVGGEREWHDADQLRLFASDLLLRARRVDALQRLASQRKWIWFYRAGSWTPRRPIYIGSDEHDRHTLVLSLPYSGSPAAVIALPWWPCRCTESPEPASTSQTFIDACLAGDADANDLDDWIDRWHESDSAQSLDEFIGLTKEEARWPWTGYGNIPEVLDRRRQAISDTNEKP
ncbi:hypothetical protein [Rhodococcoides fascians]|uniref:hypothetical protein n=1 Tax=Rhodococcoides fascians TaxID=1828 RepID=UPI00056075A8|nr:hypothetical protein [Rhodococcus fascians]